MLTHLHVLAQQDVTEFESVNALVAEVMGAAAAAPDGAAAAVVEAVDPHAVVEAVDSESEKASDATASPCVDIDIGVGCDDIPMCDGIPDFEALEEECKETISCNISCLVPR